MAGALRNIWHGQSAVGNSVDTNAAIESLRLKRAALDFPKFI